MTDSLVHRMKERFQELKRAELRKVCQRSVLNRVFSWLPFVSDTGPDHVEALRHSPIAMFFYNTRIMFLGVGFVYILLLAAVALTEENVESSFTNSALILSVTWLAVTVISLVRTPSFASRLNEWTVDPNAKECPPGVQFYFAVDFTALSFLIIAGWVFHAQLEHFLLLLIAETLLFSAFGGRSILVLLMTVVTLALLLYELVIEANYLSQVPIDIDGNGILLVVGPVVGTLIGTTYSVLALRWINWVDRLSYRIRLSMLEEFKQAVTQTFTNVARDDAKLDQDNQFTSPYRELVTAILERLCKNRWPIWESSACLWIRGSQQDTNEVLRLGPSCNFYPEHARQITTSASQGLIARREFSLVRSLQPEKVAADHGVFEPFRGCPAAFIPVSLVNRHLATLVLIGKTMGYPVRVHDIPFLKFLGYLIQDVIHESIDLRYAKADSTIDALYDSETPQDALNIAADKCRFFLRAKGCAIIQPDDTGGGFVVASRSGFNSTITELDCNSEFSHLKVCTTLQQPDRWDDVISHSDRFDRDELNVLSRALGEPVKSWLAIPMLNGTETAGAIFFVNRQSPWRWFTEDDESFAKDLAQKLHRVVDKLRLIDHLRKQTALANELAEESRKEAEASKQARHQAERATELRNRDFLSMSHQVQGPIIAADEKLTRTIDKLALSAPITDALIEKLNDVDLILQDAFSIAFGLQASFVRDMGKTSRFRPQSINALDEAKRLFYRLNIGEKYPDRDIEFLQDSDFPSLWVDRRVFISIMYSLITNAMKYAHRGTLVEIKCTYETTIGPGFAAIKVKSTGVPIRPRERKRIFDMFYRGEAVADSPRFPDGVGLGLWVARELAYSAGGDLFLVETDDSELSIFVLSIPLGMR